MRLEPNRNSDSPVAPPSALWFCFSDNTKRNHSVCARRRISVARTRSWDATPGGRERSRLLAHVCQEANRRCLLALVLMQNEATDSSSRSTEWCCLSPVEFCELLRDVVDAQRQRVRGVVPTFDRQVDQGDQQGVLVGGDERAFGQNPFDICDETDLLLGAGTNRRL